MTPTTHHITDTYLNAYQAELRADLSGARRTRPALRRTRRGVARTLVRLAAWLFPETPEIIDGRIIILEQPVETGALEKAA